MSSTATTSADAVAAGICPRQSFAAVAFLGDDSTQKNRYGCVLKLEGAWRAASRICSRSPCGISTGSKALTALLWKSASRISSIGRLLCCYYNIEVLQMQHDKKCNAGATIRLYCGTQKRTWRTRNRLRLQWGRDEFFPIAPRFS